MNMNERQQKVMENIVNICSFIVATAQASEKKYLLEVLGSENRAIFVSTAFFLALTGQDRRIGPRVECQSKELVEALDPQGHWVEEKDFVQMVNSAVEMMLTTNVTVIKNYTGVLKKLADDTRKKRGF
jgi:hypothetical protein